MDTELYMRNETDFEKALRIKGYGSFDKKKSESQIDKEIRIDNNLTVKPTVITSLSEYINFINGLKGNSSINPIFFRGQTNANYLLTPNCLRSNPENEHLILEEFERHFPNEFNYKMLAMEKLSLMQHFYLPTRALDVSENPLLALYFACSHMKKFRTRIIKPEDEKWGEVVLFQEPKKRYEKKSEKLKTIESSNISIIANTAFMENDFSLWHLGSKWKRDVDIGHDEIYIDLTTIVRNSYIVRVPFENPRIKNQQGAFIMVNANYILDNNDEIDSELTNYVLDKDYISYDILLNSRYSKRFDLKKTWMLKFRKVVPYDNLNEISIFKTDPFNLNRIFYKNEKNVQQVVLIPPDKKQDILRELKKFNITEDFVYPDMDSVANEIKERFSKKEDN